MEATNRVQQEEEISGLVLTYRVNDTLLCVPVEDVESIIEPPAITELPHAPDYVLGAFMYRGQTALALSLHKLLGLPAATTKQRKESLLVIWMGGQPIGYWVDEVKGMTDSNRGHWSAVPALIRDQGITRALVCDGQVYFPIDLTHSRQFNEITRALKVFEQSKLQSVTDEVIEPPQVEQANHPQPAQQELATPEESVLAEPAAVEARTLTDDELAPTEDAALEAAEAESIEEPADSRDELPALEQDLPLEPELPAETVDAEPAVVVVDNDYSVVDYPADNSLEEDYEEQIEASFLTEHEIDTDALARAMHAALSGSAEIIPLHQPIEVQFDINGQADAFYDLITEAEDRFGSVKLVENISDETASVYDVTEGQVDAFEDGYQALLAQDLLAADIDEPDASEQDYIMARESLDDFAPMDELSLSEEPYSFLPTALPEDDEPAEQALLDEEIVGDDVTTDKMDSAQQAELRQSEIDTAFIDDADIADELVEDETASDALNLTEEPYSFLPATLPEDDGPDEQALLDEDVVDDSSGEETISDELSLTEEPYSFLPTALPEDDGPDEQALLDEDVVDNLNGEAPIDTEALPAQQKQPLMLLPHLSDAAVDSVKTDDLSIGIDRNVSERPVITLPDETASLPEFASIVSKADFYTDKMVTLLKDAGIEVKPADNVYEKVEIKNKSLPVDEPQEDQPSAELYELKIPPVSPQDEPPEPAPSLDKKYITPQLEQGAVIIRPDGQINKNFGLVKLFTIILATSAAGSWWYRDELFYREQLRKEIPSILRNEIAFLYSNRVTIVSPEKGVERMIVDTPEQEIKVIRRNHVSRALLRESRRKDVTIHRVRKGDTLWAIASLYLDDPYRYPELAENNRIHNSDLIRPGDVVKITIKKLDTDK